MNLTVDTPLEQINKLNSGTLMQQLGIEYTKLAEGYVEARMPVDERTMQTYKVLHGGASLAFAETVGGLGSALLIDNDKYCAVGSQVAGNHVGMAQSGFVYAKAQLLHGGKRTHIWNVDIYNEDNKLVSTVRMTNMVIEL